MGLVMYSTPTARGPPPPPPTEYENSRRKRMAVYSSQSCVSKTLATTRAHILRFPDTHLCNKRLHPVPRLNATLERNRVAISDQSANPLRQLKRLYSLPRYPQRECAFRCYLLPVITNCLRKRKCSQHIRHCNPQAIVRKVAARTSPVYQSSLVRINFK
jgi:hypothetical protein